MRHSIMISIGNFFFRYRKFIFPIFFILLVGVMRPAIVINKTIDEFLVWLGFLIAVVGEGIRIFTIGLDYIERGGKNGQPNASKLVVGGLYNHVRNPMYVGNLLMALGIGLYSGTPMILATVVPFMVFFYYCMIAAEENFLRGKFGAEFDDFCSRVNRLWPSLGGISRTLSGFRFNWGRVLDKENGTAFWTLMALVLLPLWRMHFLGESDNAAAYSSYAIGAVIITFPAYIVIRVLKAKGKLLPAV